jgi:hypothetical protein
LAPNAPPVEADPLRVVNDLATSFLQQVINHACQINVTWNRCMSWVGAGHAQAEVDLT